MDLTVLSQSSLFRGIPEKDISEALKDIPHNIQRYAKDEIIFHLMETADRIGIILDGRVEAQKPFPNGSQVNVSIRTAGEMIGPAAVFSDGHRYPCDMVTLENVSVMMLKKEALLHLMQKDVRILENFTRELASSTYMLQQRVELLSYSGIAQKAACYLLMQRRKTGSDTIPVPGSMTKWAMLMNVSRPSLHRELRKLEEQGTITLGPHVVKILNPEILQEILS